MDAVISRESCGAGHGGILCGIYSRINACRVALGLRAVSVTL